MSGLFEMKTGRFIPLNEAQLARLNDEQLSAYRDLAVAVSALDDANASAENAITSNRIALAALNAAEAAERKKPRWTQLDEHRRMVQQWRIDHP